MAVQTLGMENNVNFLNARLQIAEGLKQGLFGFDDFNALNKMFGIEATPAAQGNLGPAKTNFSFEDITSLKNSIRKEWQPLSDMGIGNDKNYKAIALKQGKAFGYTEDDMRRAGII